MRDKDKDKVKDHPGNLPMKERNKQKTGVL